MVVGLVLSACGSQSATPASPETPTAAPTGAATAPSVTPAPTPPDDEWVSSGPLATSMPTRTCVTQESPVQDGVSTTSMSCFDPSHYATEPPCEPPSGATEGFFLCVVTPKLTQRVVDDWN
jgi:hypothetical protein